DFKLKHIGEMPEQQAADLQLLSQVQNQLQLESEQLMRAEQQKSYVQSMMAQSAPVVDIDQGEQRGVTAATDNGVRGPKPLAVAKANLAAMLPRYNERHPDVQRLKRQIEEEEAQEAKAAKDAKDAAAVTG